MSKRKKTPPVQKQTSTILLEEVDVLRYSEALAVNAMLEAKVNELNARYELKLRELDVNGVLGQMGVEIQSLLLAAQKQSKKVDELSKQLGERLAIDISKYELDLETRTLNKKG